MGGGAWPFLVGGVICLVDSVNERDLSLLNSSVILVWHSFLEGHFGSTDLVSFPVLSQIKPQAPLLVVPFRQFL